MEKRRITIILIALIIIFSFSGTAYAEIDTITIYIDGNRLETDVEPITVNNRTLVPMRAIFEALGANVEWEPKTETITATKGLIRLTLQVNNPSITINDKQVILDVAPMLKDDRTMVPVRAVAEGLFANVGWDETDKIVAITSRMGGYSEYPLVPDFGAAFECEATKRIVKGDEDITTVFYYYDTRDFPKISLDSYANTLLALDFVYQQAITGINSTHLIHKHSENNIYVTFGTDKTELIISLVVPMPVSELNLK